MTGLEAQGFAVITAVISALIYAVGGYLKNIEPEKFDAEKFFVTIIIAVLVGSISYYLGISYDTATQILISAGLIAYIEFWGKAIYRRLKNWLYSTEN